VLFIVLYGAARLAEVRIGEAEIAARTALAAPVADLLHDQKDLLAVLDGAAGLAEVLVGDTAIAERIALTAPGLNLRPPLALVVRACARRGAGVGSLWRRERIVYRLCG
jgi:hypothetical protein